MWKIVAIVLSLTAPHDDPEYFHYRKTFPTEAICRADIPAVLDDFRYQFTPEYQIAMWCEFDGQDL